MVRRSRVRATNSSASFSDSRISADGAFSSSFLSDGFETRSAFALGLHGLTLLGLRDEGLTSRLRGLASRAGLRALRLACLVCRVGRVKPSSSLSASGVLTKPLPFLLLGFAFLFGLLALLGRALVRCWSSCTFSSPASSWSTTEPCGAQLRFRMRSSPFLLNCLLAVRRLPLLIRGRLAVACCNTWVFASCSFVSDAGRSFGPGLAPRDPPVRSCASLFGDLTRDLPRLCSLPPAGFDAVERGGGRAAPTIAARPVGVFIAPSERFFRGLRTGGEPGMTALGDDPTIPAKPAGTLNFRDFNFPDPGLDFVDPGLGEADDCFPSFNANAFMFNFFPFGLGGDSSLAGAWAFFSKSFLRFRFGLLEILTAVLPIVTPMVCFVLTGSTVLPPLFFPGLAELDFSELAG
mmetsp:Transcript_3300/g.6366  ORF Transcript_3300/g.6366 Transcript_3300/m.6366 type:complete len:406 (-) Transcript_3300:1210-2427(-)